MPALCWSCRPWKVRKCPGSIDFNYDEATRTLTIGERKGSFKGMLRARRFNVVVVNRDNPRELDLENPAGLMVEYNGKQVTVKL